MDNYVVSHNLNYFHFNRCRDIMIFVFIAGGMSRTNNFFEGIVSLARTEGQVSANISTSPQASSPKPSKRNRSLNEPLNNSTEELKKHKERDWIFVRPHDSSELCSNVYKIIFLMILVRNKKNFCYATFVK